MKKLFISASLFVVGLIFASPASAATQTVVIEDFSFTPQSITINAGDSIVFDNQGEVNHTATANDDSWDTGTIAPGSSATITFNTAGTMPYTCTFHPTQMTGTVTVLGAESGDATSSGSTKGGVGGGETLPETGIETPLLIIVGLGILFFGSGFFLRKLQTQSS